MAEDPSIKDIFELAISKYPIVKELKNIESFFFTFKPDFNTLKNHIRSLRPTKMGGRYIEVSKSLDFLINELNRWKKVNQ